MVNIAPWLAVADATSAVAFYGAAFGATEVELVEDGDGKIVIAHLAISDADFWIQTDADSDPHALGERSPVRMILTVDDPDAVFARAIEAGATEVFPVGEDYGWRIGRVVDPSGHNWEIGKPLPA